MNLPLAVRHTLVGFGFALAACSGSEPPPDARPIPTATATASPVSIDGAGNCVCGTEPGCPPCPLPSAAPKPSATAATSASGTFPPATFSAPVTRTAKSGDGVWTPLTVHRPANAPGGSDSPVWTTTVRPHSIRDFVVVHLIAIDTTRVSMDLILGTDEPEGTTVPREQRTGLVPSDRRDALIAITNGGFKKRHGQHGVGVGGVFAQALRDDACTFAKTKDGAYRIGDHKAMDLAAFSFVRQTPPCLLSGGAKNPDLASDYKIKKWGGAEDGNKEIRRSAIAVGADPRVLYFAIGDFITADWLADGLAAAGLREAAELDINYSYTRFITYQHAGADLVASSPLAIKDLKTPKREYWAEASPRDFFALTWKTQ